MSSCILAISCCCPLAGGTGSRRWISVFRCRSQTFTPMDQSRSGGIDTDDNTKTHAPSNFCVKVVQVPHWLWVYRLPSPDPDGLRFLSRIPDQSGSGSTRIHLDRHRASNVVGAGSQVESIGD